MRKSGVNNINYIDFYFNVKIRIEEAFSNSIIPTIIFPAHATGYKLVCFEDLGKLIAGILDPSEDLPFM